MISIVLRHSSHLETFKSFGDTNQPFEDSRITWRHMSSFKDNIIWRHESSIRDNEVICGQESTILRLRSNSFCRIPRSHGICQAVYWLDVHYLKMLLASLFPGFHMKARKRLGATLFAFCAVLSFNQVVAVAKRPHE